MLYYYWYILLHTHSVLLLLVHRCENDPSKCYKVNLQKTTHTHAILTHDTEERGEGDVRIEEEGREERRAEISREERGSNLSILCVLARWGEERGGDGTHLSILRCVLARWVSWERSTDEQPPMNASPAPWEDETDDWCSSRTHTHNIHTNYTHIHILYTHKWYTHYTHKWHPHPHRLSRWTKGLTTITDLACSQNRRSPKRTDFLPWRRQHINYSSDNTKCNTH